MTRLRCTAVSISSAVCCLISLDTSTYRATDTVMLIDDF